MGGGKIFSSEAVILGGGDYGLLTVSFLTNWLAHWLLMTEGMVSLPPKPAF